MIKLPRNPFKISITISALLLCQFAFVAQAKALDNNQVDLLLEKLTADEQVMQLYSKQDLTEILRAARYKQGVINAFQRTAESLTWKSYRKIFIQPSLIAGGVSFGQKHKQTLDAAEAMYGVPKEYILAILGVETAFGTNKGKHRIIDSLTTLSLGFERRKDFFFDELKAFLVLGKEHDVSVATALGSYAGAMGYPQFISSSYLAYAVDFDGDGIISLINSPEDAIGSIANYLKAHDWQSGAPVYAEVVNSPSNITEFVTEERKTLFTLNQLTSGNINVDTNVSSETELSLIELNGDNGVVYRAAFNNFYVITTYNRSKLYAMAVAELAEKIEQSL